jgi:putative membrane protein
MIFVRWAMLAFSMWIATLVVPGITVDGGVGTYLWVALLFGLINSIFGSLIKVLTFPVSIVTFGLFLFVVNAAMLSLTARWSEKLNVTGFWSALFASLIISVITTLFKSTKTVSYTHLRAHETG